MTTTADPLSIAAALIQRLESCRLTAYRDSVGVWTIGYGSTRSVKPGMTIGQDEADTRLRQDLAIAADRLETALFGSKTVLTAHQQAALISFVFNAGADPKWTIWQDIREGDLGAVPFQLRRFVYAAHHPLKGLVNRREAEIAVWSTPDTP